MKLRNYIFEDPTKEELFNAIIEKYNLNKNEKKEIYYGLIEGLDVSIYANSNKYNWKQMKSLRLGLENGLNINLYSNPEYNWSQMKEIMLGLISKVNVSIYSFFITLKFDKFQKILYN